MSGSIVGLVLEHFPTDSAQEFIIAIVLAEAADDDGRNVYPSVRRIAALSRSSKRTVQYALNGKLQKSGFLTLEKKGGGRGKPSRYRINIEWLAQQSSALATCQKGAPCAPFGKTVEIGAERVHSVDGFRPENDANRVQPRLHPTPDPVVVGPTTSDGGGISIEDLVKAALWSAGSQVIKVGAYRAAVRKRLLEYGPSKDDLDTYSAWAAACKADQVSAAAKCLPVGRWNTPNGALIVIDVDGPINITGPDGKLSSEHRVTFAKAMTDGLVQLIPIPATPKKFARPPTEALRKAAGMKKTDK